MSRRNPILMVSSHLAVALIGLLLAGSIAPFTKTELESTAAGASGRRPASGLDSSPVQRTARSIASWRASEYAKAWKAVRTAKLTTVERVETQRALLAEWAKLDLSAAVGAAMEEAWDQESGGYYDPTGPLVGAFADAFAGNPDEAWELIASGRFGVGSGMLRHLWIGSVGSRDPLKLARMIGGLSWRDANYAVSACQEGTWSITDLAVKADILETLSALPKDQVSAQQLATFIHLAPGDDRIASLTEELLQAQPENGRIDEAKAVILGNLISNTTPEEISEQVAELPSDLRQAALGAVLENTGNSNARKYTGILDLLIAEEAFESLKKNSVASSLKYCAANGNAQAIAEWAATLPPNPEVSELFYRGVETYLRDNMQASREWIGSIEEPMWRDRAYAEYSQQALNAKKDPAASRWALDRIQDPTFKTTVEGWRKDWEKRNVPKAN